MTTTTDRFNGSTFKTVTCASEEEAVAVLADLRAKGYRACQDSSHVAKTSFGKTTHVHVTTIGA